MRRSIVTTLIAVVYTLLGFHLGELRQKTRLLKCLNSVESQITPEDVTNFYGHKTYDLGHHVAYHYMRAFNKCAISRVK